MNTSASNVIQASASFKYKAPNAWGLCQYSEAPPLDGGFRDSTRAAQLAPPFLRDQGTVTLIDFVVPFESDTVMVAVPLAIPSMLKFAPEMDAWATAVSLLLT